jgi:hypothetical protein
MKTISSGLRIFTEEAPTIRTKSKQFSRKFGCRREAIAHRNRLANRHNYGSCLHLKPFHFIA